MTSNSTEVDKILRRLSSASQGRNHAGSTNQVPKLSIREAILYKEHEKKTKKEDEKEEKMALIVASKLEYTCN